MKDWQFFLLLSALLVCAGIIAPPEKGDVATVGWLVAGALTGMAIGAAWLW